MQIFTKMIWDMSGDELIIIESESYEHDGPITDCKGGGGGCPAPAESPYTFKPQPLGPSPQAAQAAQGLAALQAQQQAATPQAGAIQGAQYTDPAALMQQQQMQQQQMQQPMAPQVPPQGY